MPQSNNSIHTSAGYSIKSKSIGSDLCTIDEFDNSFLAIFLSLLCCFDISFTFNAPSFETVVIIAIAISVKLLYKSLNYDSSIFSIKTVSSKIKKHIYKGLIVFFFAISLRYDIKVLCGFDVLKDIFHPISLFYYFTLVTHNYLLNNLIIANKPFSLIRAFITILISTICLLMIRYAYEFLVLALQQLQQANDLLEYVGERLNDVDNKNTNKDSNDINKIELAVIFIGINSTLNKFNILNVRSRTNKSNSKTSDFTVQQQNNLNTYLSKSTYINPVEKIKHFPPANKE